MYTYIYICIHSTSTKDTYIYIYILFKKSKILYENIDFVLKRNIKHRVAIYSFERKNHSFGLLKHSWLSYIRYNVSKSNYSFYLKKMVYQNI